MHRFSIENRILISSMSNIESRLQRFADVNEKFCNLLQPRLLFFRGAIPSGSLPSVAPIASHREIFQHVFSFTVQRYKKFANCANFGRDWQKKSDRLPK